MEIVKESIFLARIYEYDINFTLRLTSYTSCYTFTEIKHKEPDSVLVKTGGFVEEVFRVGIPQPLLSVGDKFFREEEKIFYTVEEVVRTDKDNVCYVVKNLTQNIISEQSQKKYDEEKSAYLNNENINKKLNDVQYEFDDLRKKIEHCKQNISKFKLKACIEALKFVQSL